MKIHRKIGTYENLEKWASQKNWDFRDLRPEASPNEKQGMKTSMETRLNCSYILCEISSSSPPQPQYSLLYPFTFLNASSVNAVTRIIG